MPVIVMAALAVAPTTTRSAQMAKYPRRRQSTLKVGLGVNDKKKGDFINGHTESATNKPLTIRRKAQIGHGIAQAVNALGAFLRLAECRQKHSRQNGDYGDEHKKLYQGKS